MRGSGEVLTVADGDRWREALERTGGYDFCHLPAFSRLAESCGQGAARLLVYREGEVTVAFPLLLREVREVAPELSTGWRDVTSVYGYAGPLASARLSEETRAGWLAFLDDYCREQAVVAAFSRLHPLLNQISLLEGYGEVAQVGWTLSLDLGLSEEQQWGGFRRNHRQDIKKLKSLGVTCEQEGVEQLDEFIAMYYDTMDRVSASSNYYFSKDYFVRLLEDMAEVAHLFMCRDHGVAVAGGIFTLCQGICQWYFSGSRSGYEGPPPAKMLFEAGRVWAKARGAHTLHLGGGVGSKRDSLYHFKRGFTEQEHEYAVWQHVIRPEVYEELYRRQCEKAGGEPAEAFFPSYRHPDFGSGRCLCRTHDAVAAQAAAGADQS